MSSLCILSFDSSWGAGGIRRRCWLKKELGSFSEGERKLGGLRAKLDEAVIRLRRSSKHHDSDRRSILLVFQMEDGGGHV